MSEIKQINTGVAELLRNPLMEQIRKYVPQQIKDEINKAFEQMDKIRRIYPKEGIDLLAVKVSKESNGFVIDRNSDIEILRWIQPDEFKYYGKLELPEGNWNPLGIDTELTEEQCREVVSSDFDFLDGFGAVTQYPDYTDETRCYLTPKEAFASLMQANGINEPHLILKRLS